MKSVFCGDCIREILNTIDGQLLEEVVLFDAEQKAFYPVRDEETLQIILLGKGLGNQKWNVSAPHGAGRILKQECVKERYTVSQFSRDKSTKKRYGRAWKRIRDKYASEHPFCELCFERGLAVPVEEIHHKKPLSEGGAHDRSNPIALCKSCHSQIHAKCGDRWG